MVAREIREHGHIERNSENTLLLERVRRHFHHRFGDSLAQALRQEPVQLQRFRRGVRSRENLPGNVIFDGSDQRGLPPGRLKYGFDKEGGRAFSVRASDSGIRHSFGGTFVEIRAQAGERAASVHDLRPGNCGTRSFGRGVGDDGNRSGGDGLINEAIAVAGLALHRDKNRSRAHSPGIVLHPGNARVSALRENLGALQELLECHWSDYK